MLSMHAEDFSRSPELATALVRQDTAAIRRLADRARSGLGGEPMVIARDGSTLAGPMARAGWIAETQREGAVVTTTAEAGSAYSVALAP
jgi:hypothetical protein